MEETKKKQPRGGSRKGIPNKATTQLKESILKSFEMVGGELYLAEQAIKNPGPYMALIGKIIPKDINAVIGGDLTINSITRKIVDGHRDSDG